MQRLAEPLPPPLTRYRYRYQEEHRIRSHLRTNCLAHIQHEQKNSYHPCSKINANTSVWHLALASTVLGLWGQQECTGLSQRYPPAAEALPALRAPTGGSQEPGLLERCGFQGVRRKKEKAATSLGEGNPIKIII